MPALRGGHTEVMENTQIKGLVSQVGGLTLFQGIKTFNHQSVNKNFCKIICKGLAKTMINCVN